MTASVCYNRKYWPSEIRASVRKLARNQFALCSRHGFANADVHHPPFGRRSPVALYSHPFVLGQREADMDHHQRQIQGKYHSLMIHLLEKMG